MALECLCGPFPPQVFLTHHDPMAITELPYPYHMNSCHLLMGGSLGAETFTFTFTFSHLADAFVQSDVQGREYSSYEQVFTHFSD